MQPIEVGQAAPDFTLRDQNKTKHTLSEYQGQPVVLLFYPMDFSSTCSTEMSCMVDEFPRFEALNARVFGISVDHVHAHRAFAAVRGIQFPLLADFHPKGEVARAYGFYREELGISSRGYVVIDPQGGVAAAVETGFTVVPDFDQVAAAVVATHETV